MGLSVSFHYLARGVIESNNHVLLVRQIGAANTFLPGGHIDTGEGAREALAREIFEEIGVAAEIDRFIGAVEHRWPENKPDQHEINLIFKVTCAGLTAPVVPKSREDHLEFSWWPVDTIGNASLEPFPIREWFQSSDRDLPAFWGSSITS